MQNKVEHGMKTELSNKRIEMERRILKSKSRTELFENPSFQILI